MQAIRLHPPESSSEPPYSADNPAPPSALVLDRIPIPTMNEPGQLLIRVHATPVTRAELTWPETYTTDLPLLGHDLAGTVVAVQNDEASDQREARYDFKPGEEVFGMLDMSKSGSTWAELAIAQSHEVVLKPKSLSWAESAAVPTSALTAWQALFVKGGVTNPDISSIPEIKTQPTHKGGERRKLAVTGAAGAVGTFIVQLAALAGLHVVAISSSKTRDEGFLKSLGATEVLEYQEIQQLVNEYDIIIDGVGGETLEHCWSAVKDDGVLISIESASWDFVRKHHQQPFAKHKDGVKALFFIVEQSRRQLEELAELLELGLLKVHVAYEMPLEEARQAYELASGRPSRRGKVVLTI